MPRLAPGVVVAIATLVATVLLAPGISLLARLGLALGAGLVPASLAPLLGRSLRRTPLAIWGMCVAHLGVAVALIGMASDSAFTREKLTTARPRRAHRGRPVAGRVALDRARRRAQLDRARGRASRLARRRRVDPQAAEPLLHRTRRRPPAKRRSRPTGTASSTPSSARRTSPPGAGSSACGGSRS